MDWIQELKRQENRLQLELGALRQLHPGQTDVDMCISLIADSMHRTIKVIAADRGQIQKTVDDGSIILTAEQVKLLQTSAILTEQANDWLSTYRAD